MINITLVGTRIWSQIYQNESSLFNLDHKLSKQTVIGQFGLISIKICSFPPLRCDFHFVFLKAESQNYYPIQNHKIIFFKSSKSWKIVFFSKFFLQNYFFKSCSKSWIFPTFFKRLTQERPSSSSKCLVNRTKVSTYKIITRIEFA